MPDVRNCKRCGKIFNYIGGAPLCQVCRDADEEDFKRIKEYLYRNPGAAMSVVSTELDIGVEKIKRFLKDGRLEIIGSDANFVLECESCGKSIKTGRFCDSCEKDLTHGFKNMAKSMDRSSNLGNTSKGAGMRYLNRETEKMGK